MSYADNIDVVLAHEIHDEEGKSSNRDLSGSRTFRTPRSGLRVGADYLGGFHDRVVETSAEAGTV